MTGRPPGLVGRIAAALRSSGPAWFPGLARHLAGAEWRSLAARDLDRMRYSTSVFLAGRGGEERAFDPTPGSVPIEAPSEIVRARYAGHGLELVGAAEACLAAPSVARALSRLSAVPALLDAVRALVAALHPVRVDDPDVDVGYSDPAVPFSIFVGVHDAMGVEHDLRLAEGIVHEAMHLQLSLIERFAPMIADERASAHSPWRGEQRPVQGVLHGAYVFRCVLDMHVALAAASDDAAAAAFHARRIAAIPEELRAALAAVEVDRALTPIGRLLADRLIRGFAEADAARRCPPVDGDVPLRHNGNRRR